MSEKAECFRALHETGCFLIPNAWDAGSAHLLAQLGFQAVATTSAGLAFMLARTDGAGAVSRAEAIANAADIAAATALPASADLEDGYGPAPEDVAATVGAAIEAGLVGCTIEDTTANPAAPHPFILTARAENHLYGIADLDDTIHRLTAFAEAGADCLYAPALPTLDAIRKVVAAVAPKPVNVLIGPRDGTVPLEVLRDAGVRRVSVGGAIARAAYGQVLTIGQALAAGDIAGALRGVPGHAELNGRMRKP